MNIINFSRPLRSRSQSKTGFLINPNQLNTNFNKKDFIGFKMKLLQNIKRNKKFFEKKEDENEIENKVEKKYRSQSSGKNSSLRVEHNNKRTKLYSNNNLANEGKATCKSKKENSSQKIKLLNFKNLMEEANQLKDINAENPNILYENINIESITKVIEIWIDIEFLIDESKSMSSLLMLFKKLFKPSFYLRRQNEYEIFKHAYLNKLFFRLLNMSFVSGSACLISISTIHNDNTLKTHVKRLITNVLKPFLNFFTMLNVKKVPPLISEEVIEKISKISLKDHFQNKYQLRHIDLIGLLTKDIDTICLSVKQLAK